MSNVNPLPPFEAVSDEYASLPLHVMATDSHDCIYCGDEPTWSTYAEYLTDYAANYEGAWLGGPYVPREEDVFDYFASTCTAA